MEITTNSIGNTVVADEYGFFVITINPNGTARAEHFDDDNDPGNMIDIIFPNHAAALKLVAGI